MLARPVVPSLLATLALACSGGDDPAAVDAAPDAPIDAAIDARVDAPAPTCTTPNMMCGAECVDTSTDEQFCGNCTTACEGGQVCTQSRCGCATGISIPAMPSFLLDQIMRQAGVTVGFGAYADAEIDVLLIGHDATTVVGMPYTLSGTELGTPPFAGFGYDVDIATRTPSAAYYATSGTLTFTKICPPTAGGGMGGFSGTLAGAQFTAVSSLTNPTIDPNGCTIPGPGEPALPTITFRMGDTSCN
jgi:hypothetical protein